MQLYAKSKSALNVNKLSFLYLIRFLSLLLVSLLAHESLGSQCACATGNVHVRTGAGTSHSILATLAVGECHPDKGGRQHAGGLEWANLDYNGHVS